MFPMAGTELQEERCMYFYALAWNTLTPQLFLLWWLFSFGGLQVSKQTGLEAGEKF